MIRTLFYKEEVDCMKRFDLKGSRCMSKTCRSVEDPPCSNLHSYDLTQILRRKTLTVVWVSLDLWQGMGNKSGLVDIKRVLQWFEREKNGWWRSGYESRAKDRLVPFLGCKIRMTGTQMAAINTFTLFQTSQWYVFFISQGHLPLQIKKSA